MPKTKTHRGVLPWAVNLSDMRRYTYRAMAAVRRNPALMIFVGYRDQGDAAQNWVCLFSYKATTAQRTAAVIAFDAGQFMSVDLSRLPPLRKHAK